MQCREELGATGWWPGLWFFTLGGSTDCLPPCPSCIRLRLITFSIASRMHSGAQLHNGHMANTTLWYKRLGLVTQVKCNTHNNVQPWGAPMPNNQNISHMANLKRLASLAEESNTGLQTIKHCPSKNIRPPCHRVSVLMNLLFWLTPSSKKEADWAMPLQMWWMCLNLTIVKY